MRIIKDRQIIEDRWLHVDDESPVPNAPAIISWARWTKEREGLSGLASTLGVLINGDVAIEDIARDMTHFSLVALHFSRFADGRCYSHARMLRERYRFQGEIRACGDVLRDQIFYLSRCGVNAFEVRADRSPEDALKALNDFSVCYQPAADQAQPLYRQYARTQYTA